MNIHRNIRIHIIYYANLKEHNRTWFRLWIKKTGESSEEILFKELLKPTIRRVGSMIAGGLITLGVAEEAALAIETGAIAAAAVAADLILSYWERRSENMD